MSLSSAFLCLIIFTKNCHIRNPFQRQQIGDLRGKVARIEAENLSLAQESTYWRNQILCLKR